MYGSHLQLEIVGHAITRLFIGFLIASIMRNLISPPVC
uniref:Uncharacterized protein n=1 Tax=Arundo donax TaxID=35708 RepID=A0A0A8Z9R8_ARUDO